MVFVFRKSTECNMAGVTAFSLSEVEEGSEADEFWKAIGGKRFYCSLAHGKSTDNTRPYPRKVPLKSFYLNGRTLRFHPQSYKQYLLLVDCSHIRVSFTEL